MKFTIELSEDQLRRANAIVADNVAEPKSDFYCGNLLGWMNDHGFNFNPDQRLDLIGNTVQYMGQRHPLQQDGGLAIIKHILQDDLNDVEPVEYQTSDPRLRWYETLADWARRIEDPWEALESAHLAYVIPQNWQSHAEAVSACAQDIPAIQKIKDRVLAALDMTENELLDHYDLRQVIVIQEFLS